MYVFLNKNIPGLKIKLKMKDFTQRTERKHIAGYNNPRVIWKVQDGYFDLVRLSVLMHVSRATKSSRNA
jgi:hypothetical protein